MPWSRRAWLAAGLLALALVVPLAAWLHHGCGEVERERAELAAAAERSIAGEHAALSERLAARLEDLREAESRRPYFHYQNLFHDPRSADLGASIVTSPLAGEVHDPRIWTYFQIDGDDELTIPTFNDDIPDLNPVAAVEDNRSILGALRPAASALRSVTAGGAGAESLEKGSIQKESIDNTAYVQNLNANLYYNQMRNDEPLPAAKPGDVVITIEPIAFAVATISGEPRIVATRAVTTPDGALTQGFVLDTDALARSLPLPEGAHIAAADHASVGNAPLLISSGALQIVLDAADPAALAAAQAAVGERFMWRFVPAAGFACLAALALGLLFFQIERLAHQRSRFAAAAAHELRTPLAGLRMYSEMIAEGLGDATRTHAYAQRICDEAARLGRVVSNVLGQSQLERGVLSVRKSHCDLAAVVEDEVERLDPAVAALGASLSLSGAEEPIEIACDRDAVAQVLQNLIDNAEKYSRGGGDRSIEVVVRRASNAVEIAVVDHGPGVDPAVLRRLFRPFVRGTDDDQPAGIGLGLSIGHALVRAHGGELRHQPSDGGGATFVIALPA